MWITFSAVQGPPRAYIHRLSPTTHSGGGDLVVQLPASGDYPQGISTIRLVADGELAVNFDVIRELTKLNGLDEWYSGIIHPIHVARKGADLVLTFARGHGLGSRTVTNAIHVLESDSTLTQGTAFFIGPNVVCTCAHCVGEDTVLVQSTAPLREFKTSILAIDHSRDVAVLKVEGFHVRRWLPIAYANLSTETGVVAYGFPQYQLGDSIQRVRLNITGTRSFHGLQLSVVTGGIIAGMSGCPVLDADRRVVGMALRGGQTPDDSERQEFQAISV